MVYYHLKYEYRKGIGLSTYPLPIEYNGIIIFITTTTKIDKANYGYLNFWSFIIHVICLTNSNCSSGNVQNNVLFQREIGRLFCDLMFLPSKADDDLSPADRVKRLLIYSFFYQNISFLQYQSKISFHGGN